MSPKILDVKARQILDSRGNPTLEVTVILEGGAQGRFSVPSGASKGEKEALELRDGGKWLHGRSVMRAVRNVNEVIKPAVLGMDATHQVAIDETMLELDGTLNKSRLGANSILGVSIAVAKAAAEALGIPLYKYIGGVSSRVMPVPFMNVINGGVHAGNKLAIQEFLIVPFGFDSFEKALYAGVEIYMELRELLAREYGRIANNVGDEGGFAPPMSRTEEALDVLMRAIDEVGYSGKVNLALDCAANEFYNDGVYRIDGKELDPSDLMDFYSNLVEKYPIVSIEDPFMDDDWESLSEFTKKMGGKIQIVGDDYFATNPEFLLKGIRMGAANALLLKVNQIGTLTEALRAAHMAYANGYSVMVSHRSGETTDPFIADLAVAINSGQIKAGAPARGERVAKYNRLLEIEEELGSTALFSGLQLGA